MLPHIVLALALAAAPLQSDSTGDARSTGEQTPGREVAAQAVDPATTPAAAPAAVASSVREPGEWLVELARHYGHSLGRTDPRSASLQVLATLEAAVQVSPQNAEADRWRYDLYQRMGRTESARAALAHYVSLRPNDEGARIRLLEIELDVRQTAKARSEHLQAELARGPLPRSYESELHRGLARFHYEKRENEAAARETEAALRLNPMNIRARELSYEIFGETEPALQRVELALRMMAANPSQVDAVWGLGEFLDQLSLHSQAQEWYTRAMDLHQRSKVGPISPSHWYTLALSYRHSGDHARVREAATAALRAEPTMLVARLLRANAAISLGDEAAATADLDAVAEAYASRAADVISNNRTDEAADLAWFHCYHRPDKARALQMSTVAMSADRPISLARLAHGYALRMNDRNDEAFAILEPLAEVDQLAALELARLLIDRDQKPRALTVLHRAATLQYSGVAFNLIRELLGRFDEIPPPQPRYSRIVKTLMRFDRRVFDYYERPGEFLKFTMRFASGTLAPMGPVRVALRLENTASYPITFGDGFMARPMVAISAKIGDKRFDNYLQEMMTERVVLQPGDVMEKIVAIDVGPMREHLIRTATGERSITVSAMFDPVYSDGKLNAGLGTIVAEPIKAIRPAIDQSAGGLARLLDAARSTESSARGAAAERIGGLLAATVEGDSGATAKPERTDALRQALAALVTDQDWFVRARAIEACGWSRLDKALTAAAAPSVRPNEPVVVRMLAVRLFAEQQRGTFRPVLEALSTNDPDRIVRIMARGCMRSTRGMSATSAANDAP